MSYPKDPTIVYLKHTSVGSSFWYSEVGFAFVCYNEQLLEYLHRKKDVLTFKPTWLSLALIKTSRCAVVQTRTLTGRLTAYTPSAFLFQLSGFPMHFATTEIKSIVEAVYATEIHNTHSNDVEFALAVHIHPYPNSVLSIWVYLASLIRKRWPASTVATT